MLPVLIALTSVARTDDDLEAWRAAAEQIMAQGSADSQLYGAAIVLAGEDVIFEGAVGPFIDSLDQLELQSRPGTQSSYSNVGYWLLGAIIEAASGMTYADYIDEAIFG